MSNLFKPRYITNYNEDARVINSNELVLRKIEEQAKVLLPPDISPEETPEDFSGDGFTAGIAAERVEEIDYVAVAKEEADAILAEANRQAAQLVEDATAQAGQIREQAREEGLQQGYAQGKEQAEQECEERQRQLEEKEQALSDSYLRQQKELEPKLVDVITHVVEHVFKIHFSDKRELLLYLVNQTLSSVDGARSFTIRADRERTDYLEAHREELLSCVGQNVQLDIVLDHSLSQGQCVIETDTGVFECGADTQIENLMKDIRALSM
ncbi:MAG: FliH/SctL family protein [Roseburia sp.]